MDKLNNLLINGDNNNNLYDFAHLGFNFSNKSIVSSKKRLLKNTTDKVIEKDNFINEANVPIMNANLQVVENRLGLNNLLYRLEVASKASNSSILKEKYERSRDIAELINNTVLSMVHKLYWTKFEDLEKSSIPLSRAFDFAIDVGSDLVKKYEQRLEQEYNLANILETEFSKAGVKKNVRK
jgi:hypothetical protein